MNNFYRLRFSVPFLTAALFVGLLLAPAVHAQSRGLMEAPSVSGTQSRGLMEASSQTRAARASTFNVQPAAVEGEAFALTNTAGDTLFFVDPSGTVITGSPGGIYPGSGEGFVSRMTRSGGSSAGIFYTDNPENQGFNLYSQTNGTGVAGYFAQVNDTTHSAAVLAQTTSMGAAGGFEIYNAQNDYSAVFAMTEGLGTAGDFNVRNEQNGAPAVRVNTVGTGPGMMMHHDGTGHGGFFHIDNPANSRAALIGQTLGTGHGAYIGRAGNGGSYGPAARIQQEGTADFAPAIHTTIDNVENGSPVIVAESNGLGAAGVFGVNNGASGAAALSAYTDGTSHAARFSIDNSGSDFSALDVSTAGTGQAAYFERRGSGSSYGPAVQVVQSGTANFAPAFVAEVKDSTNTSPAVHVITQGMGVAGEFVNENPANGAPALAAITNGNGDIAHFNAGQDIRMRVDNGGNVYADGTFQGGGADLAEAFEVEGSTASYAPGDVLVISTRTDRTVERSQEAYSSLVAGVYATKPGVLLSEKGLATNMDMRVPMGVVGVLPTKVTLEGGSIQRGDLLVTSSTPGAAMKADPDRVRVGQVLGKALEGFDGTGTGTIKVLVSVK